MSQPPRCDALTPLDQAIGELLTAITFNATADNELSPVIMAEQCAILKLMVKARTKVVSQRDSWGWTPESDEAKS